MSLIIFQLCRVQENWVFLHRRTHSGNSQQKFTFTMTCIYYVWPSFAEKPTMLSVFDLGYSSWGLYVLCLWEQGQYSGHWNRRYHTQYWTGTKTCPSPKKHLSSEDVYDIDTNNAVETPNLSFVMNSKGRFMGVSFFPASPFCLHSGNDSTVLEVVIAEKILLLCN